MSPISNAFRTGEPSLADLLADIHSGDVQLPDFQRGWVWDDDHIRSLIASVSKSFPIGAVMLLETGGDGVRFKPRAVQGAPNHDGKKPKLLILDGRRLPPTTRRGRRESGSCATSRRLNGAAG